MGYRLTWSSWPALLVADGAGPSFLSTARGRARQPGGANARNFIRRNSQTSAQPDRLNSPLADRSPDALGVPRYNARERLRFVKPRLARHRFCNCNLFLHPFAFRFRRNPRRLDALICGASQLYHRFRVSSRSFSKFFSVATCARRILGA